MYIFNSFKSVVKSGLTFFFKSLYSVTGLNFDFLGYNITGFLAYGFFNVGMYWIPLVKVSDDNKADCSCFHCKVSRLVTILLSSKLK